MTCSRYLRNLSLLASLVVGMPAQTPGGEPNAPVKIVLHPAAEPTPALKYRLLPPRWERISGNAAVFYGKVTAEESRFFSNRKLQENIDDWQETPLADMHGDKVQLPKLGHIEDELRRGALCSYCDWQLPIGIVPYYTMPLSEAQQTRQFARILAVRARLQVAGGDFDKSIQNFQTIYSLGRHVATGETIVNGLIGIAICNLASKQIWDFVQQPGAPNLYWALAVLPNPLINMSDAYDMERMGIELTYPELRDLRTANRTPEEWRALFHRVAQEIADAYSGKDRPKLPAPDELDAICQDSSAAAKQALVATGLSAAEVEAMSVYQAALLYTLQTHHETLDDAIKYFELPFPQAVAGMDATIDRANRENREIIPTAGWVVPLIRIHRIAVARMERKIAELRVLEALRIYAANHHGDLPRQLADITEVPVPNDPVTGAAFGYRRDGQTAILEGPTIQDVPLNDEITMAQP